MTMRPPTMTGKLVSRYTRSPGVVCLVLTLFTIANRMRVPVSTVKVFSGRALGAASGSTTWAPSGAHTIRAANKTTGKSRATMAHSLVHIIGRFYHRRVSSLLQRNAEGGGTAVVLPASTFVRSVMI